MSERKFNLGQITVVVCFRLIFTEETKRKSGSSPNGTEA